MNNLFYMLYNCMNKDSIRNRLDSVYWLYNVENIIVKRNGVCRRFLKVRFFNRFFNEQNDLMQMKFNFHGQEFTIKRFEPVSEYQNQNLQGFVYEIELSDASTDLSLISYITDGKEYVVNGHIVSNIKLSCDRQQLNLLNDYTSGLTVHNLPLINNAFWVCTCGFCNAAESDICESCGSEKQKLIELMNEDLKNRAYKQPDKFLIMNEQQTLDDILENYATKMEDTYGLDKKKLLSCMDEDLLKIKHEKLITDKINKFLEDEKLILSVDLSFEENIRRYCEKITGPLITTEMVIQKGNLKEREAEYRQLCESQMLAERDRKRKLAIMAAAGVLILSALLIITAMQQIPHDNENITDSVSAKKEQKAIKEQKNEKGIVNTENHNSPQIDAGVYSTIALKKDGTVLSTEIHKAEDYRGQNNVKDWENIIQISSNEYHTVGLKDDGSVVSTSVNTSNDTGQAEVDRWSDIVQVSAGTWHTVGLRKDGTVISTFIDDMYDFGQGDVTDWTDIIQVCAAWDHTIGLKSDGTVVSTKINNEKYDFGETDVDGWTDIIQIASGSNHTLGLKKDGTVVSAGYEKDGRCSVSDWRDIIAISAGRFHSIGLRKDGTVIATEILDKKENFGQTEVQEWSNVVQISAGWLHTVALTQDGHILYTEINKKADDNGQTDVAEWDLNGGD